MAKQERVKTTATRDETDRRFMALALALGYRHLGTTWPNPSVGAVLVRETPAGPVILSEGITARGGRPHAERVALEGAGDAARGATLYVTLEPCSHVGRDSPCSDAIIASGVRRVVAGIRDPDARVAGRGFARLQDAGVEVVFGVLAEDAARLHRGHLRRVIDRRPAVTLKMARTRDGFAGSGDPYRRLIITGEAANARTHLIRAHSDAILIGVSTANADNPHLGVRLPGLEHRSPIRVVFDSHLRIDPELQLVKTAAMMPTWIVTTAESDRIREARLREAGADVLRVAAGADGRLDPLEALHRLAERGISVVLCEGGPTLASVIAGHDLADKIILVTGPEAYEGPGLPALSPSLEHRLAQGFRLRATEWAGRDEFTFYERIG